VLAADDRTENFQRGKEGGGRLIESRCWSQMVGKSSINGGRSPSERGRGERNENRKKESRQVSFKVGVSIKFGRSPCFDVGPEDPTGDHGGGRVGG